MCIHRPRFFIYIAYTTILTRSLYSSPDDLHLYNLKPTPTMHMECARLLIRSLVRIGSSQVPTISRAIEQKEPYQQQQQEWW